MLLLYGLRHSVNLISLPGVPEKWLTPTTFFLTDLNKIWLYETLNYINGGIERFSSASGLTINDVIIKNLNGTPCIFFDIRILLIIPHPTIPILSYFE